MCVYTCIYVHICHIYHDVPVHMCVYLYFYIYIFIHTHTYLVSLNLLHLFSVDIVIHSTVSVFVRNIELVAFSVLNYPRLHHKVN